MDITARVPNETTEELTETDIPATRCVDSKEYRSGGRTRVCEYECCDTSCCAIWSKRTHMGEWAIAGIVFGVLAALSVVAGIIRTCCVHSNRANRVIQVQAQPDVSVITSSQQQQPQQSGYGMQYPHQAYPPGPGMSADTKFPPALG
ncbi:cysteine and tyrosine-rich protein 1-like [Gigantopelta aegis]|uniref:cysteine and tyrosine-rich protein 1-like n=1 Tax=Gigantopelta aegis TaxID=1735272 RepID=UPI001B8878C0|nr:cysteine and tyrosine-rich protein 1-like [Gigantopelta aegis]